MAKARNYGPNNALIQGARDVGRSTMPADLKGLDKVTKAGTDLAVSALGEIQKIEQKKVDTYETLKEAAEKNMLEGGGLGKVLHNYANNSMNAAKNNLLKGLNNGDPSAEFIANKEITEMSSFMQDHKATVQQITSLINPEEGGLGLSKYHAQDGGKSYKQLEDIISGNYSFEKNKDGKMAFKLTDGTALTPEEVKKMYLPEHMATGEELGKQFGNIPKNRFWNEQGIRVAIRKAIPSGQDTREFTASMLDGLGGEFGDQNLPNLLKKDFDEGNLEAEIKSALGQDVYSSFDTDKIPGLSEDEKNNFIKAITDPNHSSFNYDVSKTIFEDKLVDAVRNKHETYWTAKDEADDEEYERKQRDKIKIKNLTTAAQKENNATAGEFLNASNTLNFSILQGRKTAAGKEAFFKRGGDGKMRFFYNKPVDPEKPTQGDRENAIVMPDDALTRYLLLAGLFGLSDKSVGEFKNKAKNMGTTTGTPYFLQSNSSRDPNINPTGSTSNLGTNAELGLNVNQNLEENKKFAK